MTNQDWERFEQILTPPAGIVKLLIDGYRVTVIVVQKRPMHFGLELYIDGVFKLKWLEEDCEIRRRFCRKCSKKLYSAAQVKELGKGLSQKRKEAIAAARYEYYLPCWNTAKSLKAHLIKNNQSIEFLMNGGKAEHE